MMWWLSLIPWKTILLGVVGVVVAALVGWGKLKTNEADELKQQIRAMERARELAPIFQEQGKRDAELARLEALLNELVKRVENTQTCVSHPDINEFFNRVYDNENS